MKGGFSKFLLSNLEMFTIQTLANVLSGTDVRHIILLSLKVKHTDMQLRSMKT